MELSAQALCDKVRRGLEEKMECICISSPPPSPETVTQQIIIKTMLFQIKV